MSFVPASLPTIEWRGLPGPFRNAYSNNLTQAPLLSRPPSLVDRRLLQVPHNKTALES